MTEQAETVSRWIMVPEDLEPLVLYGPNDEILRAVERGFPNVTVVARGAQVHLSGVEQQVALVENFISELIDVAQVGNPLTVDAVDHAIKMLSTPDAPNLAQMQATEVLTARGKTIRPKTAGQQRYVEAIEANTIVFGIGPAGTGKTYLAMAKAVNALVSGEVRRIILTRPAVEAGESLGFLPGTLTDKIDPYLRPLYDALHDMIDPGALPKLMAAGTVEVAPLAYMRGRTLNDAFIILDEAQNTTSEQMKMFLTRLGFNSRVVVTGDVTQVDLPTGKSSGLRQVEGILEGIPDLVFCHLTSQDVVRHTLVGQIIDAYQRFDEDTQTRAAHPNHRQPVDQITAHAEIFREHGERTVRRAHGGRGRR
ncbi:MAG: PhoH family protein [Actinomycetaceae bacterium]|nr:PhoH family protein [Actinomycetaceae bacterium]